MKRRDLLRAALGAPLALACEPRAPGVPDGELLDPGMALGHRLRDEQQPAPGEPVEHVDVVIVGAGVAGLACARELRRLGIEDVRIVEIADAIGGTARGGSSPVTPFPWGAHYITAPMRENVDLVELLREAGALEGGADDAGDPLAREGVSCRAPEERVFFRGRFYDGLYLAEGATADDLAQLERFKAELARYAALVDARGRRAFAIPRAHASDDAELLALDKRSFGDWLTERGLISWRLRWLCDYACRDDYGLHLDDTSAWAGLFYFCARRRSGTADERPVMTWPDGNAFLVRHLASAVDVGRVALEGAAVNVVPVGDAVNTVAVDVVVRDRVGSVRTVRARSVVVAAPRFVASRIVQPLREAHGGAPAWLSAFTASPWVVCNIHLRERPRSRGAPFSWDTVLVESKSLGYVTATHQRGADVGPTVLTWYLPLVDDAPNAAREKLLALGRADWAEAALSELAIAHQGFRSLVTRVDVCRWGHAMIRPVPGLFSSGALAAAQTPVGRVHFAHTDLSGLALFEEAFFHGIRAAREVAASRLR